MSVERVTAAAFDDASLAALFNLGYSGYFTPLSLTGEQLAAMMSLQDLDRASSPVLLVDGAPAAFAFLGVRGRRGWIGGMGVAPGHRGAGLGRRVMEAALERATALGLESVDLEVLVENEPAARIYRAIGFRDRRSFEVWERPAAVPAADTAAPLDAGASTTPASTEAVPAAADGLPRAADLETLETAAFRRRCAGLTVSPPPWQRGDAVIDRLGEALRGVVAVIDGRPAAGVLVRPDAARTSCMALASDPEAAESTRRATIAAAFAMSPASAGVVLNLPDDDPFAASFAALGFRVSHRQKEMRWTPT